MDAPIDPMTAPAPEEVPLRDAPLLRVIAQVRFPLVLAIEQREFIAPFQEAVRADYPVLREERTQAIVLSSIGGPSVQSQTTWRFSEVDAHWRVSLAPEFVALETTAYTSRKEFAERLRRVLFALEASVEPKLVDRLGVRYVDRIRGAIVDRIGELVRPEVRGITGTTAANHVQHSVTESVFAANGAQLLARWGVLPPGATVDAGAIAPIEEKSWILDLDISTSAGFPFEVEAVVGKARGFCERVYTFFRWAVTDQFLRQYGGNI